MIGLTEARSLEIRLNMKRVWFHGCNSMTTGKTLSADEYQVRAQEELLNGPCTRMFSQLDCSIEPHNAFISFSLAALLS